MKNNTTILLIFGLTIWILILQFVFLIESIFPQSVSFNETIRYIAIAYRTAMHVVVAALLLYEMDNLTEFGIDKFTVATFIIGSFLEQRLDIKGDVYFHAIRGLVGLVVIAALFKRKPNLMQTNVSWSLVGIVFGAIAIAFIFYIELVLRGIWVFAPLLQNSLPLTISNLIVRELFTTAILEEVLFRGFLWGHLRRLGWDNGKTVWFQGILFWLTHVGRLFTPFTLFITIPVITIISSKLTSHSRQVFPAIVSHATINILSAILNLATY